MKKAIAAAVAALSICAVSGANAAPGFRMIVKGRPQVVLERMSYDQTIIFALDEFIAYMNAIMMTTDYNGRGGLFTLSLAIAGDGSCELADEVMAKNGHSRKTNTGGEFAKHGIWHAEIADCVALAKRYGMTVSGVHMHIGSGTDFEHLKQVCDAMTAAAKEVGASVKTISCGGGLPVPYQSGEEFIDLEEFARLWHETKAALEKELGHEITLEIEPGRYIVAESGFLVAQIRAIKSQGENAFYLVDAGFTHLVRPMAYGSYHPISVAHNPALTTPITEGDRDVVVGGPLCESGDVFTQKEGGVVETRTLPAARVGDYLVIEVAGAYGAAMASNYNSKFLAPEVLVENGVPRLIRKKQSFEHLIANEIF